LSIDTGIPMSVLKAEPDEFLQAMHAVLEWRRDRRG
jgi:hypothetical protein